MRRWAVGLVARRELTERVRERSFLVGTCVSIAIIALVVVLPPLLGFGETTTYVVATTDRASAEVVRTAGRGAGAFDVKLEAHPMSTGEAAKALRSGDVDAVLGGGVRGKEELDTELVGVLQASAQLQEAGASGGPPLRVTAIEPVDEREDELGGLAFFTILILYGQLLTYGFWVASGVVEEKASRVVEILLSTIRPRELLAGKVIGLGLLGLGNLLLIFGIGLGVAKATGALDIDGAVLGAAALALAWFVVGYAFYACAFACAGALVSRQEDLQSTMTPLTVMILVSFFLAFAVRDNPDGTLAHITAFIPMTAPLTVPPRIVTGDIPAWEIVASLVVTVGAAALLIPVAARIYAGGILRTGSALKLRDAWRAARA